MSRKRTFVTVVALSAAIAMTAEADDALRHVFASCAGRLSAQMEHQWLLYADEADRTEDARASMLELLGSVTTEGNAIETLHWRIQAKHAQAVLLTRATFNDDQSDADWAARRAAMEIAACTGLLLS